jgi:hypothetical protein
MKAMFLTSDDRHHEPGAIPADRTLLLWFVAGAALLVSLVLVVWHFRTEANPARQLAFKASRVDVVERMQLALASASEAEKSAVLATTDQESQRLADQARAASAEVERERQELGRLLATGGTRRERDLLAHFGGTFGELQRIEDEVLKLAVRNTNLKAYALSFGPAAETLARMDAALARVIAKRASSPDARRVMQLAFGARIAALRIQTLLAPHIAEESDANMDRLEASMTSEERQVLDDLEGLRALPALDGDADLATAASSFARYRELEARILALSRENTNVRSLALALNQARRALFVSADALSALRKAILEEPIAGVDYGRPPSPR